MGNASALAYWNHLEAKGGGGRSSQRPLWRQLHGVRWGHPSSDRLHDIADAFVNERHQGDSWAAMGELVSILLDAGLIPEERDRV
jgi:hypothetical protein